MHDSLAKSMFLFSTFPLFPTVPGWRKNDPVDRAICTGNPTSFVFPLFQSSLFRLNFLALNLYGKYSGFCPGVAVIGDTAENSGKR